MGRAVFSLSQEALKDLLHLPITTTVIGMQQDYRDVNALRVMVEDAVFPDVNEVVDVEPTLTRHEITWNWNLSPRKESE